jgi:hypothetical protein
MRYPWFNLQRRKYTGISGLSIRTYILQILKIDADRVFHQELTIKTTVFLM